MAISFEETPFDFGPRELDKFDEGQTILLALYVCVLAICCVTPIVYFIRLQMEYRHHQHLRRLEEAGIIAALHESQQNREENRAARRKYLEERKARIYQLFRSFRLTLQDEHFVCLVDSASIDSLTTDVQNEKDTVDANDQIKRDVENGDNDGVDSRELTCEDGSTMIRVPLPGLYVEKKGTRLAPGVCAICLCDYEVGTDVVWSSNASCEHIFHAECIEAWLMKQREGPLCPCCRRDFVIDPYDCDGEEWNDRAMELAHTFDSEEVELPLRQDIQEV
ncbi:hypothetical protein FisN_5Hh200 [Fistulifera solaris]|uniref:RING-type domain-containing protein n=1 Tax=Fistulifera solaris TaxID=1519565 RepID=A0A1Z5JSS3_FISSO|nr:hypothetical protein FisN_5Hh200 [Fistulifera solaris]|eukprot:GAX16828.1 hypothetical protein FisN_5Hh200 [Fistulifera solaris]